MADYRYRPRDLLIYPREFGRNLDAVWDTDKVKETRREIVAAAYFQHVAACLVYAKGKPEKKRVEKLAARVNVNADTFRRKLFGESPARFDELLAWAYEFGVDVLPSISSMSDVWPSYIGKRHSEENR